MNVVGGYVVTDRMLQMFRRARRPQGRRLEGGLSHVRGVALHLRLPAWLAGAAAFVIGLHQMNIPATARSGNRMSAVGMTLAVVATAGLAAPAAGRPVDTALGIIVVGFLIGGGIGL